MKRTLIILSLILFTGSIYLLKQVDKGDTVGKHDYERVNAVKFGGYSDENPLREVMLGEFVPDERLNLGEFDVLDSKVKAVSGKTIERRVLVRSKNVTDRVVIVTESYFSDNDTSSYETTTMSAVVGDELIFELDFGRVDELEFAAFLELERLSVFNHSRLSDFAQIRIQDVSLDRYDWIHSELVRSFPQVVVEPDYLNFTSEVANDYNPSLMWNLNQVGVEDAWEFTTGSDSVAVAVIDTGMNREHPDLVGNLWVNPEEIPSNGIDDDDNGFVDDISGWDFVNDDNDPSDVSGHGTHVTGTVGAQGDNDLGVIGMNWNISLLPLKAGENGSLATSDIAEAMRYAAMMKGRGLNLVATNNSYGSDDASQVSRNEIRNHQDLGILFVAAAGNDGANIDGTSSQFPAGYDEDIIISVANTNQIDALDNSSSYGLVSVDLGAPGKGIYSTDANGQYGYKTGTSMASPLVAGAVALVASSNSDLDWRAIKDKILDTVDEIPALRGRVLTGGRLNVAAAVKQSLLGFSLAETNHSGDLIFLSDLRIPVEFNVESSIGLDVVAEVLDDKSGATIRLKEDSLYEARFSEEGVYTIRFSTTSDGVTRELEKTVFVGDIPIVDSGLSHLWNFDGSGASEEDLAGSADGVLTNVGRENSVLGKAGRFSGDSSSMSFAGTYSPQITLSAMVRADQINNNDHPRIINLEDYYLYISSDGGSGATDGNANVLKFYSNRSGEFGVWNTNPRSIQAGKWIHVAATYDSTLLNNNPVLYIDGRIQPVRVQRPPTGSQTEGGGAAFLGDRADGTRGYDGLMDEVRIYNRELSQKEIASLAADHYEARWDDFVINVESDPILGQPIEFVFGDDTGRSVSATFEWSVISEQGIYEIENLGGGKATLVFRGMTEAVVVLKVSDATATEYFATNVALQPESVGKTYWRGDSSNGALIFIESSGSSDFGYATLFDPESGFYRIRENIDIEQDGSFSSSTKSDYELSGTLGPQMNATIANVDLTFVGTVIEQSSTVSEYAGDYYGGLPERDGEYLRASVLPGGEILITRFGRSPDMAFGVVDANGLFSVTSINGSELSGIVAVDAKSISGAVVFGETNRPIFMRRDGFEDTSRFINLSTRGLVGEGERVLVGGFVVQGNQDREVLIRAVGPGLNAAFGLERTLADPSISLFKAVNDKFEIFEFNENWEDVGNGVDVGNASQEFGAFELAANSLDASMLVVLEPGRYTAIIEGQPGQEDEALFEVYDGASDDGATFVNVSTRGIVAGDDNVLIGGFVIEGDMPKEILLRAVGPGLDQFSVSDPLANPRLDIYRNQELLTGNDNWMDDTIGGSDGMPLQGAFQRLNEAFSMTGAFGLAADSGDAAVLVWLPPGAYTVIVSGVDGSAGVALVEAYELP